MFPNPQSALPLPARPDLQQYKKLAKELLAACKSSDPKAIGDWAARWTRALRKHVGFTSTRHLPVRVDAWVDQVEEFANRKMKASGAGAEPCSLASAQFVIARSHGFESWPKFARHIEQAAFADSLASRFEFAADAVVAGDLNTLQRLLSENPELVRARSPREHSATLLHYVSANGVEGYRQKTPANIVQIAEALLAAGAEVDAKAFVYGGESTALSLTATSGHPQRAGVQNALLETLLRHGASIDGDWGRELIRVCLANGRHQAAEFLASRGAPLDLEGAAGIGRLDIVTTFFKPDGSLKATATMKRLQRGFLWACEYGHDEVVRFLLDKGTDIAGQADTGQSGLHWAVVGGHLSTIDLLLKRGAPLEEKNVYGGTALGQELWSFLHRDPEIDDVPIFKKLLAAGAKVEDGSIAWMEKQEGRTSSEKLRVAHVLRRHGATS